MKTKPQATFKIDGNADQKRVVKSWLNILQWHGYPYANKRNGRGAYGPVAYWNEFQGATAQDMPQ